MKKADALSILVEAAEQVPQSPRIERAIRSARKQINTTPAFTKPEAYSLCLSNTARALNCIGDGLAWAQKMKESGEPTYKILPILQEQNRRAKSMLEL